MYCLTKTEVDYLIKAMRHESSQTIDEGEFAVKIQSWQNWELEFVCLATSVLEIADRKQKQEEDNALTWLDSVVKIEEKYGFLFRLEGFNEEFVQYMLKHTRTSETLEHNLVSLRTRFADYEDRYGL